VTAPLWLVVGFVACAATTIRFPVRARRARWRVVLRRTRPDPPDTASPTTHDLPRWVTSSPARSALLAGVATGCAVAPAAGPVAGALVAAYTVLVTRSAVRRHTAAREQRIRRQWLDRLSALAADLRAGLSVPASATAPVPADRLAVLAAAATRLAERTGAPLADLLERVETDARAAERAMTAATAQAAGARATGWLLAALPAGGIALGYAVGVDPLHVLLHTPAGVACAAGAVVLQLVGLLWADWLGLAGRRALLPPGTGDPSPSVGDGAVAWSAGGGPVPVVSRPAGQRGLADRPALSRITSAAVGLVAVTLVGGWSGAAAGVLVAVGLGPLLRRVEPAAVRRRRRREEADLPLAADLLAAVLRSGAPVDRAATAVAEALGGPLGDRLARVGRTLRLGGDTEEAWSHLGSGEAARRLATLALRSSASGAALARGLVGLAGDLRADRLTSAEAAARRAGVLIVLPLGLCFLPAFILAGLLPVIVAVLGDVL
jgi:Flp pilus assembly protein TadB